MDGKPTVRPALPWMVHPGSAGALGGPCQLRPAPWERAPGQTLLPGGRVGLEEAKAAIWAPRVRWVPDWVSKLAATRGYRALTSAGAFVGSPAQGTLVCSDPALSNQDTVLPTCSQLAENKTTKRLFIYTISMLP